MLTFSVSRTEVFSTAVSFFVSHHSIASCAYLIFCKMPCIQYVSAMTLTFVDAEDATIVVPRQELQ